MALILTLNEKKRGDRRINIYDRGTGVKVISISLADVIDKHKVKLAFDGDGLCVRESICSDDLIEDDALLNMGLK